MHRLAGVALLLPLLVALGCASDSLWRAYGWQPVDQPYQNPTLLPATNHQFVWENVRDVVDDYFTLKREVPVRLVGDVLTEGRLDTFPKVGSTLLEPWHHDSANRREKLESTLQSIRRQAVVRVIPAEGGFWVDVAVFKYLEDVVRPDRATAGDATFRHDNALSGVVNPVGEQEIHEGWIELGRDVALQQRILGQLLARFAGDCR